MEPKKMMMCTPIEGKSALSLADAQERAVQFAVQRGYLFVSTGITDEQEQMKILSGAGIVHYNLVFLSKVLRTVSTCHAILFTTGWEESFLCVRIHDLAIEQEMTLFYEKPVYCSYVKKHNALPSLCLRKPEAGKVNGQVPCTALARMQCAYISRYFGASLELSIELTVTIKIGMTLT